MNTGLFDALTGDGSTGYRHDSESAREARYRSVLQNLNHILNTRQGSLQHLPDYGLPDLGSLYRGMPDSVEELRSSVQETIEKFEPRLGRVRVKLMPSESSKMRLALMLTSELDGERVRFSTTFSSAETVHVDPYTRPE